MVDRLFSLATTDRIFLQAVGHANVSISGANEISKILEIYGLELLKQAMKIREITGRKTIKGNDIKLCHAIVKIKPKIYYE